MTVPRIIRCALVFAVAALAVPALACGPEALGTARVLRVSGAGGPTFGTKQYAETLPLADREVVLTFDDGPNAGTTNRVLDALAAECVRATFFLIGRHAQGMPHLVQRTAREGHTLANHTWSHPWTIAGLSPERGLAQIDDGAAAITQAAGGAGHLAPFVRFPGFVSTPALMEELKRRNVAVFGTDLWASDWNPMAPETQLALVLRRLDHAGGGIVLFHDSKAQTAAMIPEFLRALKARGYRVVHVTG